MVNKCKNPEDRRKCLQLTPLSTAEKELLLEVAAFMGTSMSTVMRSAFFALAIDKGFTLPSSATRHKGNDRQY